MKYQPITCVWEITMGCNMRCGHCGSSCAEPLEDELSTEEALKLCDQIAELGLRWVTLSGGEPLTRKDLPQLVERLSGSGVAVNIITNGWLLDQAMAAELKKAGISTAAISIDGTEEIHDSIRREGAFQHAGRAFAFLKENGIETGAVTTITKQNIDILRDLKEDLIKLGVDSWQVQIGLPMGNMKERPDWLLEPEQISDIIRFCYETALEGRIRIYPADCIGYYTTMEQQVKRIAYRSDEVSLWDGCNAGIRGFGILQNGDILGCTSIRDSEYIEGNIRERPLREIWEDENSFQWRRGMEKSRLKGLCGTCTYGSKCLGGCPNTRLTINGSMESENQYCAYHHELEQMEERYQDINDGNGLFEIAQTMMQSGHFQEAAYALDRVIQLQPADAEALKAKGYCEYMCGNYERCRDANAGAMEICGGDPYALRGYAIALWRLGQKQEGLNYMKRAVALGGSADEDIIMDLQSMEGSLYK